MMDQGRTDRPAAPQFLPRTSAHPLLPSKPGEFWDGVSGILHVKPKSRLDVTTEAHQEEDHVVGVVCEPIS